jgi:hypothetical protein
VTKYKEYVQKMLSENKELFDEFRKLHDDYALNPNHLQDKFNKEGSKILEIIHEYENRLCANTERGIYNKYSGNLAEKFQDEVRTLFPMIDHVGIRTFNIKKINLQ